ncbi:kynureninase [Flammeovirgaceae bacterium SG7u.111]|nr:kynureninase [Flammeovirgaceae bacterium SG7u.132]WPO34712.1 kynureninase [Flammeovirgaceae bacterium SG7u.111]
MGFTSALSTAKNLDKEDWLKKYRSEFLLPSSQSPIDIYFCGNSLGLQPSKTASHIERELSRWQDLGVEGFFNAFEGEPSWMEYQYKLSKKLCPIVGAQPSEVALMNSLTVNLHFLLVSFYRPSQGRYKILMEAGAFPSDQYAMASQLQSHGCSPEDGLIELTPREGEETLRTEDILSVIEENAEELALVLLGGVNYYTGQLFELEKIAKVSHGVGAVVGFDLAHAVGNVPLKLHDWGVDFAVWCNYKYMNGGPGTIGGLFVHETHGKDKGVARLSGWWGNDEKTRFLMQKDFQPAIGANGWQLSTPPVLLLAALHASLDIFEEVGMEKLVEKSKKMVAYLRFLIDDINKAIGEETIRIVTPESPSESGAQLSLVVEQGKKIFDNLIKKGIVVDWREPNVIRLAPVPLYNTFEEIFQFYTVLKDTFKTL